MPSSSSHVYRNRARRARTCGGGTRSVVATGMECGRKFINVAPVEANEVPTTLIWLLAWRCWPTVCIRKVRHRTRLNPRSSIMPATAHVSYWHETAGGATTHYPPLQEDVHVDVAVVGGGITGLTAAAWLQQSGRRVALLEADQIGCGTSGFTSGHLD